MLARNAFSDDWAALFDSGRALVGSARSSLALLFWVLSFHPILTSPSTHCSCCYVVAFDAMDPAVMDGCWVGFFAGFLDLYNMLIESSSRFWSSIVCWCGDGSRS
ncbi:hypothetical protein Nepgr_033787 [Nepenthes gracilis]|uniref:Uncharacterized protein n=1 Tax=Nepenthes gracilis TaxID=150966 RepID=A0AAD3TMY7_NEPGR|nr:hypothetical protein Nepgr_033787 [Nepenthes gracilis]